MLFSIVVPIYNVEKYIEDCLESIIYQIDNEKNYEIILVDDGSTDRSGLICDEYQRRHPNFIMVYHNTNHGLLWTRRFGFKQAKGDYVINCDSDDLLEDEALVKLKKIVKKYKYPDIVIYNHNIYDGKNKTIAFKDIFTSNKDCIVEKKDVLKEFLCYHSIVSVCGKMIKRDCIDAEKKYQQFGRISTGEDTLQSIEFFSNAKTFVYLNETIYNYRCGSGMTGKFDENYYFTFKKIFEEIEKQSEKWEVPNFDELFAIKVLQTAGRAITQSRYNHWKFMREHIEYLGKIREDRMLQENTKYLDKVKDKLQKDHYILLKLLKYNLNVIIVLLLNMKNMTDKSRQ